MYSHTGEEIAKIVLEFLDDHDIDIKYCRGQSYDNAANMRGKYRGVQTLIREKCEVAHFVPCTADSLSWIGKNIVGSCRSAAELFDLLQTIYSWLGASTHHWQVHRKFLDKLPVAKALSDTRWSARYDAVRAINKGYRENILALEELASDNAQPHESRIEAEGFLTKLKRLETAILLELWDSILDRFQKTNLSLQKSGLSLNKAMHLLEALETFVRSLRYDFEIYEEKGRNKSEVKEYRGTSQRIQVKRRFFVENDAEDTILTPRDKFKVEVYLVIIDQLTAQLEKRLKSYRDIENKFGFLSTLTALSSDEIHQAASLLMLEYPDLEEGFPLEMVHFAAFFTVRSTTVATHGSLADFDEHNVRNSDGMKMFRFLRDNQCVETFPSVHVTLRKYLCMMASNCTGERSFSRLKRTKDHLRSTMGQN